MEKITVSVILGGLLVMLVHLYKLLILKPKLLRGKLERQGIKGPSPSFLFGNIPEMKRSKLQLHSTPTTAADDSLVAAIAHDWPSTVFPYLAQWRNEYGTVLYFLSFFFFFFLFFLFIIIIIFLRMN
jgi:hypothetical protein